MNKHHAAHYIIAAAIIAVLAGVLWHLRTEDNAIDTVAAGPAHLGFAPAPTAK